MEGHLVFVLLVPQLTGFPLLISFWFLAWLFWLEHTVALLYRNPRIMREVWLEYLHIDAVHVVDLRLAWDVAELYVVIEVRLGVFRSIVYLKETTLLLGRFRVQLDKPLLVFMFVVCGRGVHLCAVRHHRRRVGLRRVHCCIHRSLVICTTMFLNRFDWTEWTEADRSENIRPSRFECVSSDTGLMD